MSSRFEITKKAINRENTLSELEALSERIDVMYLIGGKFTDDEYMELSDMIEEKIVMAKGDDLTETYKEKLLDESDGNS